MVKSNNIQEYVCHELPTFPIEGKLLILVTGASGYIGGRLVPELLERGYQVRVMVRKYSSEYKNRWPNAEIAVADADNQNRLQEALMGVDVAYYLIHSLHLGTKIFESNDILVATNFRKACEYNNVKRIIYLGGLGKKGTKLSAHLESRIRVAEVLSEGTTPVTALRAGMIIGSGSASYEILKNLVDNTPIFFIPKWAKTKSQPISIRAVIMYLVGVLEVKETIGNIYDIGGPDILTYNEKLVILSKLLGKRRIFLPGLIPYAPLYGYIVSLLTRVPAPITKVLVEGCKNEVICENGNLKSLINIELYSFKTSLVKALSVEERDMVSTRWSDAYPPAHDLAIKLHELKEPPRFTTSYSITTIKSCENIFKSFCKVGGKKGWFQNNWSWWMRGVFDKIFMGIGTARGRRSSSSLRINDVIDFWRVENIIENKTLLLRAEMNIPGKAWLEFYITEGSESNKFTLNAYYVPKGIKGYLYWYNFLPFHGIIFKDLLKQIERKS